MSNYFHNENNLVIYFHYCLDSIHLFHFLLANCKFLQPLFSSISLQKKGDLHPIPLKIE